MSIRLKAVQFPVGEAVINPSNYVLISKVQRSIRTFRGPTVVIEGHTDTTGADEVNKYLSQQRAESVQQYMVNAMRIPSYRLIATGFGETNPVANNETASGRARNRRIDIIIKPNLEAA